MPRRAVGEMTVSALNKRVAAIEAGRVRPGLIRVGGVGGLALNVRLRAYRSGTALSASWVLRRTFEGRRRDFALGAWPEVGLAQARERARIVLDQLFRGIDPLAERREAARANAPRPAARTFREAAKAHFNLAVRGRINARDEAKWMNDLETFAFPVIGELPVDQIETAHMMEVAQRPHVRYGSIEAAPFWEAVPERARRCIKKVETVLAAETVQGHRSGHNPATWRGHLDKLLPDPQKVRSKVKQPALPHAQMPAFMAALRSREPSPSARALEFLILTAVRSGEVRGATWGEIDMGRGLWTIPAARMKASRDHRVPLSGAAMAVLKATPPLAGTDLIWPGAGLRKPMSDATLAALVKKMAAKDGWADPASGRVVVPHGFRSTFRDWAAEETAYPAEMAELALAHNVGSAVERAYRRGDQLEKRRAMMEEWAAHALSAVGAGLRAVG